MTYTKQQQKENRKKWVEALRSGRYEQGSTRLRTSDNGFCCLGVLCEVAGIMPIYKNNMFLYQDEITHAPRDAMDFVGLKSSNGAYDMSTLIEKNDDGKTFSEIADIIEQEPEGLFEE